MGITHKSNDKGRDSNLELFRIISMLLIIAHHYVVNSGLTATNGPIYSNINSPLSIGLLIIGAFGKTGINCFVFITGYFMCKSKITLKKFLKLYGEILFYGFVIWSLFILTGYDVFSIKRVIKIIIPFYNINQNFTGCFVAYWLVIPFVNTLINNINEKQHLKLLMLLLFMYVCIPSVGFILDSSVSLNYMVWFIVLHIIASYIRIYPKKIFSNTKLWGIITFISLCLSVASIIIGIKFNHPFYFVADSNKILAFALGLSSFMFFKNINIPYSKMINLFGGSTFGILLIHAHSDAMRKWLWQDLLNNVSAYSMGNMMFVHLIVSVLLIFIICTVIDTVRIKLLEKPFLLWIDRSQNKWIEKYNNIESLFYEFVKRI